MLARPVALVGASGGGVIAWGYGPKGQTNVPADLINVVGIAAGDAQSLALRADGTVSAWGGMTVLWRWDGSLTGITNAQPYEEDVRRHVIPSGLSNIVAVAAAAGEENYLALRSQGTVVAWGDNFYRQREVPAGLSRVVAVAAGGYHSLALRSDGTVVSWGSNENGQTNVPPGLGPTVAVAAGSSHSLALQSDGRVVAWGDNSYGQTNVPADLRDVVAIAAGGRYSLALRADGSVAAWTKPGTTMSNVTAGLSNVVGVAAGLGRCLALLNDGRVAAWSLYPTVSSSSSYMSGTSYLNPDSVSSWPFGPFGGFVFPTNASLVSVPVGLTNALALAAGGGHQLALVGGPESSATVASGPFRFLPMPNRAISVVGYPAFLHLPVFSVETVAYQWRWNGTDLPGETNAVLRWASLSLADAGRYSLFVSNRLGTAESPVMDLKVASLQFLDFPRGQTAKFGDRVAMQVQAEGLKLTYQWQLDGRPLSGATNSALVIDALRWDDLGAYTVQVRGADGVVISSPPAIVALDQTIGWGDIRKPDWQSPTELRDVAAAVISDDKAVFLHLDGQVSYLPGFDPVYPDRSLRLLKVENPAITNAVAVACDHDRFLAVLADGTVRVWPASSLPNFPIFFPTGPSLLMDYVDRRQVPVGLSNVVHVVAGENYNLALKADGRVTGWGRGLASLPDGLTSVVAVAAKGAHNLALRADGRVVEWGSEQRPPVGLDQVTAIAVSEWHSLALRVNGTVIAWGADFDGQCQVPAGLSNVVAVAAGVDFSLALQADGSVRAWGANNAGQTALPPGLGAIQGIAAGGRHALAWTTWREPKFPPSSPRRIAVAGSNAWLYFPAFGAQPMAYQWRFEGRDLPGQTNAFLQLEKLGFTDAGEYSLVASNRFGAAISPGCRLEVPSALILDPPSSLTAPLFSTVTFSVRAEGQDLHYQWKRHGVDLSGETNQTLVLRQVSRADAGEYAVRAWNAGGSSPDAVASLQVGSVAVWPSGARPVGVGWSNVVAVAASQGFGFGLQTNGKVLARYQNGASFARAPYWTNIAAVTVTENYARALRWDGTTDDEALYENFSFADESRNSYMVTNAIAVAGAMALLEDGTVTRVHDYYGFTLFSTSSNLVGLATGNQLLALRADGSVRIPDGLDIRGYLALGLPGSPTNAVAIATGTNFGIALKADGRVETWGWGENSAGPTSVPPGLSNVVAVSAMNGRAMALKVDGTLAIWGVKGDETPLVADLNGVVAMAAGPGDYNIALMGEGPPTLPPLPSRRFGLAGAQAYFYAPAVGELPMRYQWRFNGQDLPGQTNVSLAVTNLSFDQAGDYHLIVSNRWGSTASPAWRLDVLPLVITRLPEVPHPFLGSKMTLAVQAEGANLRYQWRQNGADLAGATNATYSVLTTRREDDGDYSVLVTSSWGEAVTPPLPVKVAALVSWQTGNQYLFGAEPSVSTLSVAAAVTTGREQHYVITRDGMAHEWIPNTNYFDAPKPRLPEGLTNMVAVTAGADHLVALRRDGTLLAFGANLQGQTNVPPGLTNVVMVSANFDGTHTLALTADGFVKAWGVNNAARLSVPDGLSNMVAIAAGGNQNLALKHDGTVVSWGYDTEKYRELVSNLHEVTGIAAGGNHNLVMLRDGSVRAWGSTGYGGTNVPAGLNNLVAVAAGGLQSLALRADGTVLEWGGYSFPEPHSLPGLSNVVSISSGGINAALIGSPAPAFGPAVLTRAGRVGGSVFLQLPVLGRHPISYQWRYNGRDLPGRTNALLSLANLKPEDAGSYTLSVSNPFGAAVSEQFSVLVIPDDSLPPRLTMEARTPDGGFRLWITGGVDRDYDVLASSDLIAWQTAGVITNGGAARFFPGNSTNQSKAFYRLRQR